MIGARLMCVAGGAAAIVLFGIAPPVIAGSHGNLPPGQVQVNAPTHAETPSSQIVVAQVKKGVDRDVIREIQRLLANRGFDPGPADGRTGRKTGSAIARYQKSTGLAVDGRPSRDLLDHLRKPPGGAGTDEAAPVEEVETVRTSADPPPPPPAEPPVPSLTNTVWRFIDETGSEFTLTFGLNGAIRGVLYEQFWRWRQTGNDVTIAYDNGMGLQVTRTGTLTDREAMSGSASASHGDEWTWMAERIQKPQSPGNSRD